MIIDKEGNILPACWKDEGVIVEDGDFKVFVPYERDVDKAYVDEILEKKKLLSDTDFKVIKHMEGELPDEEFEVLKKERQGYRDRINELEGLIQTPTLPTDEQIKEAERKATLKAKGEQDG